MANLRKNRSVKSSKSKSAKESTRSLRGRFSSFCSLPSVIPPIKASFGRVKRYTAFVKNTSAYNVKSKLVNDLKNTSSVVKPIVCPVVPIQKSASRKSIASDDQILSDRDPATQRVVSSSFFNYSSAKHRKNSPKIASRRNSDMRNERKLDNNFNKVPLPEVSVKLHDVRLVLFEDDEDSITTAENRKVCSVSPVRKKNNHDIVDDESCKPVIHEPASISVSAENFSLSQKNIKPIKIFKKRTILKDCEKKCGKNVKKLASPKINKVFRNKKLILNKNVKKTNVCIVAPFRNNIPAQFSVSTHYQVSVENNLLPHDKQGSLTLTDLSHLVHPTFSNISKKTFTDTSKVHTRHSSLDGNEIVSKNSEKVLGSELDTKNSSKVLKRPKTCSLTLRNSERIKRSVTACDKDFVRENNATSFQNDVTVQCSITTDNPAPIGKYILPHNQQGSLNFTESQLHVNNSFSKKSKNNCISVLKTHTTTDDQAFEENNILSFKDRDPLNLTEPLSGLTSSFSKSCERNLNNSSKISARRPSHENEIVYKSPEKIVKKLVRNLKKSSEVLEFPKKYSLACKNNVRSSLCISTRNSVAVCDKDCNKGNAPLSLVSKHSTSSPSKNHLQAISNKKISVDTCKVSVKAISTKKQKIKPKKVPRKVLTSKTGKKFHDSNLPDKKKRGKILSAEKSRKKSPSLVCRPNSAKNSKKLTCKKQVSKPRKLSIEKDFYNDTSLENVPLDSLFLSLRNSKALSSTCEKDKDPLIPLKISASGKTSCKQFLSESDLYSDPSLENVPLDSLFLSLRNSKALLSTCEKDKKDPLIPLKISNSKITSCKQFLSESDLYSDLSFENVPLDSLMLSARKNSMYDTSAIDSDYEDDLYDPKQFEKFKTLFKYATDTKLELILASKMSHLVADLSLNETAEFIESVYVPVDSLSRSTNEILPEPHKSTIVEKHRKKTPSKKKSITSEREQFSECLADEPIEEKYDSKNVMTFADFLRLHHEL